MTTAPPRPRAAGAARRPAPPRGPSRRPTAAAVYRGRLRAGRLVLALALLAAMGRLVVIQTVQAPELDAARARQLETEVSLPALRGRITDRDGNLLAFSVEAKQLDTNPRTIAATRGPDAVAYKAEMAAAVAAATGGDAAELTALLAEDRSYVVLARVVDPDVAAQLQDRFPEIAATDRESRQYPAGDLAAPVIGAATWNAEAEKLVGLTGLESGQDNTLTGSPGLRIVDTAGGSNTVIPGSLQFERAAVPGSDLQLTLDSDLQHTVQRLLLEYVTRTGAKPTSSVVVLDRATAEVRAMASGTTFDPAQVGTADQEALRNSAVVAAFEPGSVNKVVTMAAAIEDGVARPDDVLDVPGSIQVADRTVRDAWEHGVDRYTLTGVLAKSSNVGTLMTAREVGEERFVEMLGRFGLGERSGVGLPGEESGSVPPRETWSGSTFGNLPIGQGLSMTTLQMAGMYQAIANDGLRIPPRIVAATTGPDGVRVEAPRPEGVRVVSPQTAATVRTMLTAVTQDVRGQRGTGTQAAVPGYHVAGKTGTAQQIDPACGCYSSSTYNITFAGMLPAQDPRYVIAIVLDAPAGGTSAAPLFHDIASYLAQRDKLPVSAEPAPVQQLQLP